MVGSYQTITYNRYAVQSATKFKAMVGSRRSFLVYVAAILRHEPILAQPLGFVHGFASAVEQPAVQ